jgi:P-aminobenzoate N-oxygenase AurF
MTIHDVDAVLAIVNDDPDAPDHRVGSDIQTVFTWDYDKASRPALSRLYEKAKVSQWNATEDLDWDADVDPQKVAMEMQGADYRTAFLQRLTADRRSPVAAWGDKEMVAYSFETFSWRLSQFLHGEQGALLCTARIVETVPWIDAKYYAATQVMDEARHVEVFSRYLTEKLGAGYPINAHLQMLLDDILTDSRWDVTYLGMQIMVEGLALAAFGFMHQITTEPLLKKLLRYVMSDEARHVAFGVLSLQEVYQGLTAAEIRERQEFAFDATIRMRDRFLQQELWDRLGVDVRSMVNTLLDQPAEENQMQKLLFSKIVPNCRKLGLLDAGDGWLRKKYTEIGIIEYEHLEDTGTEYASLDEVAKDRGAA